MPIDNGNGLQVEQFIARHVNPAPGRAAEDYKARILHWLEVANNPSAYSPGAKDVADVRRKARQNVRRLVQRHPAAAAMIDATTRARGTR